MTNLLILGKGDEHIFYPNQVFNYAEEAGFNVQFLHYYETPQDFFDGTINVLFFFPLTFWNEHCEIPHDTRLYGTSNDVYEKFKGHFHDTKDRLEHRFGADRLNYIIPPEKAYIDRDKILTLEILQNKGVPTTEMIKERSLDEILEYVTPEQSIWIKSRYGAHGKGITVLYEDQWFTNYKVQGNELSNYGVYDNWPFSDITNRRNLLENLLSYEVIVEKEILWPDIYDGKKWDARVYVIGKDTPHFFVKLNDPDNIITNFSQGGKIIHHPYTGLGVIQILKTAEIARNAGNAFGSNILGVDIMFHNDQPLVVEAQTFTGFPHKDYFNLPKYLIYSSGLFVD